MDKQRFYTLAGLTESVKQDTISINFPQIKGGFTDYHELDTIANTLTDIIGKKVKSLEVNMEDFGIEFKGTYTGIFYISRKPTKAEIAEMVEVKFGKGKK